MTVSALPSPRPLVSVVSPVYNEEGNLENLVKLVDRVMQSAKLDYELVLVDDGSTDATWPVICQLAERYPIRGISLARNFGHQNALFAGLRHAQGQAVVSMDGDLQHPPELIPQLVEAWKAGYRFVNTKRTYGDEVSSFKRWTSTVFYKLFSALTRVPMSAGSSDFRLLDRSAVTALTEMNDTDLFLRGMVSWLGFKATTIPYTAQSRTWGQSKYNLRKMLRFALTAILSFSTVPLRLGVWIGFLTSFFASLEVIYILIQYARGETVAGWASTMAFMALMFGILFVLLGIVGMYIGQIYEILKARPRFLIGEKTGFGSTKQD